MKILYDVRALDTTTDRMFPESRHRSPRILKKLTKRHGGEFRQQPCIFRYGETFIAHPSFRAEIERQTTPAAPGRIG